MNLHVSKYLALLCLIISSVASAQSPTSKASYILAGRLFDATSDTVRENVVIAIEDDRIRAFLPQLISRFRRAPK